MLVFDADGLMIWGEDTLHCEVGHYFSIGMPVDDYLNITGRDTGRDTATRYGFRWKGRRWLCTDLWSWRMRPDRNIHPALSIS